MKKESVQGLPRLILLGTLGVLAAAPWAGAAGRDQQTGLWAGNRGGQAIEVQVERSWNGDTQAETISLNPGEIVAVERWDAREKISIGDDRDLFLISAPAHFDARAVEVQESLEPLVEVRPERGRGLGVLRAAANGSFTRGREAAASTVWGGSGALTLDLNLREGDSAAAVRLKRADGGILGYVDVSSTRPVKLKIGLASLAAGYRGPVRADLKVQTGRAEASLAAERGETVLFQATPVLKYNGDADYSYNINWSWNPTLYFYIYGGPAHTPGDLFTKRNGGSWDIAYGWLSTNGSGYASRGPWSWSSSTADEYAEAYIRWQYDWTTTDTDWHIWDRNCPSITRTSASGSPPAAFQGSATDGSNGACFKSSHSWVRGTYRNTSNGLYWNGSSYGSASSQSHDGWISGMPGCSVTWSCNVPPSGAHVAGNCYEWKACIYDGGCDRCTTLTFCK